MPLKCLQQGGIRIVAANGGGRSGSIVTPHYNNQPPFSALSHGTQILFSSHCSLVYSLQCRSATVSLTIQGRTHCGNHSDRYTMVTRKQYLGHHGKIQGSKGAKKIRKEKSNESRAMAPLLKKSNYDRTNQ